MWTLQNFSTKPIIHPKYAKKVSLENGTILLKDFQASDETTYRMLYENSSRNKQIQLCALVSPTFRCKPNIKHEDNFLIASLDNHEDCGKPLVSVRWMEYPGVTYISKSRIELQPGNQSGIYRACIEGESLNCVKNASERDNCDYITILSKRESIVPTISETPQWKTDTIVGVTIVSLVILLVVVTLLIKLFWTKCGIGSKSAPDVSGLANPQSFRRNDGVGAEGEQARQEREPFAPSDAIPMQEL
ncbi:hypothetical protein ACJMK2_025652 [Sinanodonta woodiana]|uniref:Uncharacterized protein n=1 Tax=Sinanodonta woodiana TaxID=1069815 RepID=A0ABD3XH62_SINWO